MELPDSESSNIMLRHGCKCKVKEYFQKIQIFIYKFPYDKITSHKIFGAKAEILFLFVPLYSVKLLPLQAKKRNPNKKNVNH